MSQYEEKRMKYLITGGSGFLGSALTEQLIKGDHTVIWVSQNADRKAPKGVEVIDYSMLKKTTMSVDVIINLAGAGVADKRWSNARKQVLRDSRLLPTQAILDYITQATARPNLLVSGSAIGWYGIQADAVTEQSEAHDEFTHQLCDDWEKLALSADSLGVKTAIIRTGVVMSPIGGMLGKLKLPFSLGMGGKLSDGKQLISWISLHDWVRAVEFIVSQQLSHSSNEKIYNLTAPNAISNATFTREVGRWLNRPTLFSQPKVALELLFGEMSVLLLGNQQVIPQNLLNQGFDFSHTDIAQVLERQSK